MDVPILPRYPPFYLMCPGIEVWPSSQIGAILSKLFTFLSFSHHAEPKAFWDSFNT